MPITTTAAKSGSHCLKKVSDLFELINLQCRQIIDELGKTTVETSIKSRIGKKKAESPRGKDPTNGEARVIRGGWILTMHVGKCHLPDTVIGNHRLRDHTIHVPPRLIPRPLYRLVHELLQSH
jgi:hypothetical protein